MATRTRRNTIRAIDDSEVDHIVHEWLSAAPDTELGRFLGELNDEVFSNRRKLLQYIKNPGLKDVEYTARDGSKRKLSDADVKALKGIPSYITHLQNQHGPKNPLCERIDPLNLTIPSYDDYQEYLDDFDVDNPTQEDEHQRWTVWNIRRPDSNARNTSSSVNNTSNSSTSNTSSSKSHGLKKTIEQFTVALEDGAKFDEWNRGVIAVVGAQQINWVLDPSLTPPRGSKDEGRFKSDNSFFYAVLVQKVKTKAGAKVIRDAPNGDGQLAYQELVKHYTKSQEGKDRKKVLKNLIDTARMPVNRKDKSNDLLLTYVGWMDDYDGLSEPHEKFTNEARLSNIENFVSFVDDFQTVEDAIDDVLGVKAMTAQEKINCYLRKSVQLDSRYRKQQRLPSAKRGGTMVHNTEIEAIIDAPLEFDINHHSGDNNDEHLVIDMNTHSLEQVIEMYATRQQGRNYSRTPVNPDAKLHTGTYRRLSPEGRQAWLNIPELDRIIIASGQKDESTNVDNTHHPSPGQYRTPTRTSSNQHSVTFTDSGDNKDGGTADLEVLHARVDAPSRVDGDTTSFMSALRDPFTREELQGYNPPTRNQGNSSPKRDPGDILRVLSPSQTFSPTVDQDQDQDGWAYGETGDGEDTKRESKKKMFDKVSNLFQRATSHGRSPSNKHSISSVSSYSANMFRIDVSDPDTHGILGDEYYETDDEGNERLRMNEETGEQDGGVERCNPPELTDGAEEAGEHTDAVEEGTRPRQEPHGHENQDVDEIGERLQALQVQEPQVEEDVGWGRDRGVTFPFNEEVDDEVSNTSSTEHAYGMNEPNVRVEVNEDNTSFASYDENQVSNEENEDNVFYGEVDSGVFGADDPAYQEDMATDLSDIRPPTEAELLQHMVRMYHQGIHVHRAITNLAGGYANRTVPPPFDVERHPDSALLDSGTACSVIGNHWTEFLRQDVRASVIGIAGVRMDNLYTGSYAAVARLTDGQEAIVIVHRAIHMPGSSTILSRMQLRAARCGILDDPTQGPRFIRQWGMRHGRAEEFDIDVQVTRGLSFVPTRAIQDGERGVLPEIELTSNVTVWDPHRFDTVSNRVVTEQDSMPTIRVGNNVGAVVNEALHANDDNIPNSAEQALELDTRNGNSRWRDAIDEEITRLRVRGGYDGLSRNYHPTNIPLTFRVDPLGQYRCDVIEQQTDNPSPDVIGERKEAWARHWHTSRVLPELTSFANAWEHEKLLWREAFGRDWEHTLNYYIDVEDLLNEIRGEEDKWNGTIFAAYYFANSSTRKKMNLRCRNMLYFYDMICFHVVIVPRVWTSRRSPFDREHRITRSNHTIVIHPYLLEMLRVYQFEHPGRTIVEGLVFGSSERYEATRALNSALYNCESVDYSRLLRYHDYTGLRSEPPPVPPEMMPLATRVTYHLPVNASDWSNIRVAPNGEIIMAGNERIRARFTVGVMAYQEGYQTDVTVDTDLSNQVEEDNVDDDVPIVIIEGSPNSDPIISNTDDHYEGSVDSLNYESENDVEDNDDGTINDDNDSDGRGVTNDGNKSHI